MGKHFVTVCVFCLLCATHTPCSAHVEYSTNEKRLEDSHVLDIRHVKRSPMVMQPTQPDVSLGVLMSEARPKIKRDTHRKHRLDDARYIEKIFSIFGNGESMNYEGFKSFIMSLNLDRMLLTKYNDTASLNSTNTSNITPNRLRTDNVTCLNSKDLITSIVHEGHSSHNSTESNLTVDSSTLKKLCPVLLYQMVAPTSLERQGCIIDQAIDHEKDNGGSYLSASQKHLANNVGSVWLYSTLSIIIISTCGLLGVLVIPIMQQHFYQHLIQFLVALAVGTLSGDALLHLLPHSMMAHEHAHEYLSEHSHVEEDPHNKNIWRGFVAMIGIIFFFFMEKGLTLGAEWRKQRQLRKNKVPTRVRIMREPETNTTNSVGEKLCKHKYSSYPYCYDVIATETQDDLNNRHNNVANINNTEPHNHTNHVPKDVDSDSEFTTKYCPKTENNQNLSKCTNSSKSMKCSESNKMLAENVDTHTNEEFVQNESYTVILREHENKHHGHSHTHGHVHSAPKNMSSVAWMVIMGDGLHNFTDGMAIGAAFAGSLAGGFSTSVAVFCHELPHEIGDFAVLLKAGMTAKQAVFYNMLSSILCMFGMVFGVFLGNKEAASSWIFASAAGMFLYIALVDMIPELTTSHSKEGGSLLQCGLQFMGLASGLGIMLVIALYEHDLKSLFQE